MLKDLLDLHAQIPDAILAHRAKRIKYGMPYKKWSKYRWYHFLFKRIYRRFDNIQTGVGGVLYPPHSLKADMMNVELFTKLAPSTDDIWFWAAGAANGFPVVPVPFGHNKPRGLHKPKELSLKTSNFKAGVDRNAKAFNASRYNLTFINQAITITASVTLVCYIMYTVSPEVTESIGSNHLYLTTVLVLLGLLRYIQIAVVDEKSGDPVKVMLHDRFSQLIVLLWLASYLVLIYL